MPLSASASSRAELLSALLLELMEILRDRQGDTWLAMVRIAAGKSATIAIDDTRLYVAAENGEDLQLKISAADPDVENSFESKGNALKDVMFGRSSLEKCVASGKIFIRASFSDLLKIRSVVAAVLLDSAIEPRLLSLWERFDREWQ
ncbi:hypothetical protein H6F42_10500 [Pseudanabaena sp. FACHB-1998]|uniref:hypothetical protein n=1 Tax=Pseudanabaena sp. FACHB-1998 TaxID=2692858 RepID=UPI0016813F91|nr:hypothetical protein [Pseudanabaena sp. FACHB-1998]MBD2177340.1 hypothetical protein [Pseudanabaena sp. FACHB-1998]